MNKRELKNQIRDYLNRPSLTDDAIDMWLSAAEGEMARELREHPKNRRIAFHENTGTQPLSVVQLPPDVAQLEQVLGADDARLPQYPTTDFPLKKRGFVYTGNSLHVYPPLPAGAKLTMLYSRFMPPLVNDLDDNWISEYHADLYLYGALKEAAVYLKDDVRLQLWQTEFVRRLAALRRQGWNEEWQTSPRVRMRR
jgi:hypothetical protein